MSRPSATIATTDAVGSVLPQESTVWRDKGEGAIRAKWPGSRRRSPKGSPRSHAITRTAFIAVAVSHGWRCVRANPRYRL
jgi:hypothetical protein